MQQKCMKDSLASPANVAAGWWTEVLDEESSPDESCTWRYVYCLDGTVVGLEIPWKRVNRDAFEIIVGLLPQTMQFLHLAFASVLQFSLRDLARDLKHLYIQAEERAYEEERQTFTYKPNEDGIFDTSLLPRNLRRALMRFRTPMFKTVLLRDLPNTLEYVHFDNKYYIESVLVTNPDIPKGLKEFFVYESCRHPSFDKLFFDKVRVQSMKSDAVDERIDVSIPEFVPRNREYDEYFWYLRDQVRGTNA